MSRYRPPSAPRTPLITPAGYQAMQDELDYLWRVKRPEVTRSVSEAAAQGDRSENAEYIYGKKLLREIDRRVRFLEKRLPELRVVREAPTDPTRVWFGARVELEAAETGDITGVRIVGTDEFDPKKNWISIDSPMARALLKKAVDDEVQVETPVGRTVYYILDIHYEL